MKSSNKFIVTAGVISVGMMAAAASADFGVLDYNGLTAGGNIPFTVGNAAAVGNDGYTFSNHSAGANGTVTIGLKAIAWQGANFDLTNDITYSSVVAGGSWLNRDGAGTYLAATGAATETRDSSGNIVAYPSSSELRSRWSFVWNASQDGVRPGVGLFKFNLRMIVDGPAASALSMDLGDLSGNFWGGPTDPKWQNAWNSGFSFLSSAGTVYEYGNWNIKLQVFNASGDGYTSLVGEQAINVLAVPAPGAIAMLGIAGFASRRRRA